MAIITSTPTLPQVEGILRRDFFRAFLGETGLGAYGTATSGGAGQIIDTTKLKSSQYDTKDHVGGWARISYDAGGTGAAPEGEHGPVTTYDPATGTITVNPAFSVNPAVGDLYELWHNVNPADAKDMLDACLVNDIFMPCWTILTEVPDGDMEQNNTTDWTASNATLTKATAEPVMGGKRYLQVLATSANGYAVTAAIFVQGGQEYHVSALCRAGGGTAKLEVIDADTSTSLGNKTTTLRFNHRVFLDVTVPTTTKRIQIKLVTVDNGFSTYWDEVCGYGMSGTDIRLPWWVKNRNQVLGIFQMKPLALDTDLWDGNFNGELDKRWYVQDNGAGALRVQSRFDQIGVNPLYILGLRNETAYLNDNTDKKYVDSNLLFAAFGYKIYSHLYQRNINSNVQAKAMKEMRDTFYWNWKNAENAQLEDLNRIFKDTASPEVWVGDELSRYRYGR